MKKLGLMLTISTMLAVVPSVPGASLAGRPCKGTRMDRQIGLHVHMLTCSTASRSIAHGGSGFRCKPFGQTRMIPYTIRCSSRRHNSTYYLYMFYGG